MQTHHHGAASTSSFAPIDDGTADVDMKDSKNCQFELIAYLDTVSHVA